jgi:hypothetical protein
MDIANISVQSNQIDNSRFPAKSDSTAQGSEKISLPSSIRGSQSTPEAQMLSISSNIDYIQKNLDAVLINYPPFFPAGHPQRIDLIKGLKGIQDKIEKSSIPADVKKGLSDTKLSYNSSDGEISAALDNLIHFKDSIIQNNTEGPAPKQPGSVVNIKI